jgi:hypothetical protein
LVRAFLPLTATAALVAAAAAPAGAAIGPVHTAPSSGPPGTTFTVSGSGCGPGLTLSSADFASVSSSSLRLGVHVPVDHTGSWHTTFHVPSGSLPVPALVTAACFTNGLPSLTTIYTPATFVVTAAPTPTTSPPPPPPPPTSPTPAGSTGTSPTTKGTTGSTTGGKGAATGAGASSGSGSGSGAGRSGRARTSSGRGGAAGTVAAGAPGGSAAKRSGAVAGLRSPELASDSRRTSSGISPWWWGLLALLVAGAIGAGVSLRRRMAAGATGAATPDGADDAGRAPGSGAAGPDGDGDADDDWPAFPVLDDEPTVTG